jgi:hypothetical protein
MKLYKYKSLKNLEHVTDIICNNRFYASQYYGLNDPMEGLYNYTSGTKEEYLDEIKKGKQKLRICSFSEVYHNPILWAHYADDFKGICIEVEVEKNTPEYDIVKVEYSPVRVLFNSEISTPNELPKLILSQKAEEWSVEKEFRLLTNHEYIQQNIEITRILLGVRMPDILKKAIDKLAEPHIQIFETVIGQTNNIEIGSNVIRTNRIQKK